MDPHSSIHFYLFKDECKEAHVSRSNAQVATPGAKLPNGHHETRSSWRLWSLRWGSVGSRFKDAERFNGWKYGVILPVCVSCSWLVNLVSCSSRATLVHMSAPGFSVMTTSPCTEPPSHGRDTILSKNRGTTWFFTTDYNQIMASLMGKMMTKHDKTGGFGSTQFSDTDWDGLNQHFQLLLHAPANTWMCKNGHIPSSPKKNAWNILKPCNFCRVKGFNCATIWLVWLGDPFHLQIAPIGWCVRSSDL